MVYASPDRLGTLEQLWVSLPRAEVGRPVESPRLASNAIGVLRSVGGLTTGAPPAPSSAAGLISLPRLTERSETVQGLWARQITFDNPQK
jgi:hypothetical protein